MAEKYENLYIIKNHSFPGNCSVMIQVGALVKDNIKDRLVALLNFKNLSSKTISRLTIDVIAYDEFGIKLGVPVNYTYQNLNCNAGDSFGKKEVIVMPDSSTVKIKINVSKIVYKDKSIWDGNQGHHFLEANNNSIFDELGAHGMSGKIYDLDGVRGRHIDVYADKVVLTVKAGIGSFLTGNISDGEKTIYYSDCIGIQFKKSGFQIGYLQFETAGGIMNNKANNFFNENTFTWDTTKQSNDKMQEVANYCKKKVDEYKLGKYNQATVVSSPADELKKFKELLDMGVITQNEFDAKKKQLLGI